MKKVALTPASSGRFESVGLLPINHLLERIQHMRSSFIGPVVKGHVDIGAGGDLSNRMDVGDPSEDELPDLVLPDCSSREIALDIFWEVALVLDPVPEEAWRAAHAVALKRRWMVRQSC